MIFIKLRQFKLIYLLSNWLVSLLLWPEILPLVVHGDVMSCLMSTVIVSEGKAENAVNALTLLCIACQ